MVGLAWRQKDRQMQPVVRNKWADGGGLLHLNTVDIQAHEHGSHPDEQESKLRKCMRVPQDPVAVGVTGSPQGSLLVAVRSSEGWGWNRYNKQG